MAPVWTSEQKKVIELHNRNILVSAAAGSGKTAVLVQRIIEMISDKGHPVDIDKLVIVTFTNAAAYEMRQRIMDAIEERLILEPDNTHLRRQQTLINHAQITTIDSFCLNIIRSYFSEIDLDPGFKVADEGELKLLMSDVMDEMIEDYYNEGRPEFIDFVECFTPEKTDSKLGDYILNLYRAAQSNPWPKEWLEKCRKIYCYENEEDFLNSDIMQYVLAEIHKQIDSAEARVNEMINISSMSNGPYMYLDALKDDLMYMKELKNAGNIFDTVETIKEHKWARLSSKKDMTVDDCIKETVKTMRDNVKKALNKIMEDYLNQDIITAYKQVSSCFNHIDIYVEMTLEFMERFDEKKRRKNIINFNDMEHFALNILIKKDNDEIKYTKVADELSNIYEEILIDEYQDSNLVQELILNSISRERFGKPNVFMVGDVKQSIYRFRLARPELFIEKYNSYSVEDGLYQKIELHNNFRSRATVLESVNQVFEKIMIKSFGNIAYDDNAKLYAGADFPENEKQLGKTQVMLLEWENDAEYTELEAEALLCAAEIKKIVNSDEYLCWDKATNSYRKIRFNDIAILMRSAKQNADVFVETFMNRGIPAVAASDSGYFGSYEVVVLLDLLNIIDNPRQDIPLVSVLKSYFGGFTNNELAKIRSEQREVNFYEAFMLSKSEKKDRFLDFINKLRHESEYKKIHELIWNVVYDTGYYDYIGTMPMGKERQANIDMLIERAKSYENTSFYGLFNFVRYIERLKTYDVDYGGASLNSENDDVVKIMTIHKSKGLEFPIVFLANAHKSFSNIDANQKIVIDADLGLGMDYMDCQSRVRYNTITKKAISMKMRLANLNEEQRILYVAMTRAKEKLYVTGCVKNQEKNMTIWNANSAIKSLGYSDLAAQKSYLDMIMPLALEEDGYFNLQVIKQEGFSRIVNAEEQNEWCEAENDNKEQEMPGIKAIEEYVYPYKIVDMPVKMTVSELKHMGQNMDDEFSAKLIEEEIPATVPQFIAGEQKVIGAARGSAYHKLMEIIDFEECIDNNSVKVFLEKCVEMGRISAEWAQAINIADIVKLLNSDLGQELKIAAAKNRLYRERQFVMGIAADEVDAKYDAEEMILVQGIIDVYYETDEGIVLADYKTDSVACGEKGKKELVERYQGQLAYYAKAITNLTGKPVIKKVIYSFKLGEEILI